MHRAENIKNKVFVKPRPVPENDDEKTYNYFSKTTATKNQKEIFKRFYLDEPV